ncbi:unnamed protein product, partial [Didymodactylos carnosus]
PDFNRKELLNKFVQDVEYILLLLGDQYSKSNIKKEITEQLHFLKGECGKTASRTRMKKELCWKHTILLVLDVEKNLNVDEKYNDWLNPNFEHTFQVDDNSSQDDQENIENLTDISVTDQLTLEFEKHVNYIGISMPRKLISYIFKDHNNMDSEHYQEVIDIIINYLNEESLKDDVDQAVLERSLKWTLRTAYATQIKA